MTELAKCAYEFIARKGVARSPEIAKALGVAEAELPALLAEHVNDGLLVSCSVTKGDGSQQIEFRVSAARPVEFKALDLHRRPFLSVSRIGRGVPPAPIPRSEVPTGAELKPSVSGRAKPFEVGKIGYDYLLEHKCASAPELATAMRRPLCQVSKLLEKWVLSGEVVVKKVRNQSGRGINAFSLKEASHAQ